MIVIGADSHKRTHTVVAVDEVGRRLGERTVATTTDGHLALLQWSASWPQVRFTLEDCRHLTRRLEADLLTAERSGLPKRLREHATSDAQGARLLRIALAAGGDFTLTRLWVGTRKLERQLKNRKAVPRLLCPACPTPPRRRLGPPDVPTLLGGDG